MQQYITHFYKPQYIWPRAHKNGRLEYKHVHVTPIEACSPGKIIELLLKIEQPVCA